VGVAYAERQARRRTGLSKGSDPRLALRMSHVIYLCGFCICCLVLNIVALYGLWVSISHTCTRHASRVVRDVRC